MGFNNGYDSGYTDALEDVRNNRVASLGPVSRDGGTTLAPTYLTNTADRYATVSEGTTRVKYRAPESVTAKMNGATLDLQVPTDVPVGTVMNVTLMFEYKESDTDSDWLAESGGIIGVNAITVNGTTPSGMSTPDMYSTLGIQAFVLWYNGASWVCVTIVHDAA